MKKVIAILISILTLLSYPSVSQDTVAEHDVLDWISERIEATMEENQIPAISVGIIRDGEVVLSKGFGVMNWKEEAQVDAQSIYQLASLSKTLTGIIANHLVLEGTLDLEASITVYLDKVLSDKSRKRFQDIKLKQLMQHTAGLPRSASLVSRKRKGNNYWIDGYSEAQFIVDINKLSTKRKPGVKWEYSNFAYAMVGYICEQASGQTYDELLKKYLTGKYQLSNTASTLDDRQLTLLPTPYMKEDRTVETKAFVMGKLVPASAVYSNINDLTTLMTAQLAAYREYDQHGNYSPLVLTKDVAPISEETNVSYGLGLFKVPSKRATIFGHGGDIDGFGSEYQFCPAHHAGIVLLTSSGGRWIGPLAAELFEGLLADIVGK